MHGELNLAGERVKLDMHSIAVDRRHSNVMQCIDPVCRSDSIPIRCASDGSVRFVYKL